MRHKNSSFVLIILYLNGINHKTVSEQCSFIFIFYISFAHDT